MCLSKPKAPKPIQPKEVEPPPPPKPIMSPEQAADASGSATKRPMKKRETRGVSSLSIPMSESAKSGLNIPK